MRCRLALTSAILCLSACATVDGESGGSGGSGGESSSGGSGPDTTSTSTASTGGGGDGGGLVLGPELCPTDDVPVGVDIGDRLGSFEVRDCDGATVSLDAFCGAPALWIFAAHAWCPLCRSVSGKQEAILADFADRGLVAINVVAESVESGPPDAELCALWREQHGQMKVYTLYDPTQQILDLWPDGTSSLSAFVDADRTIVSKLSHVSDETVIRAELERALSAAE